MAVALSFVFVGLFCVGWNFECWLWSFGLSKIFCGFRMCRLP